MNTLRGLKSPPGAAITIMLLLILGLLVAGCGGEKPADEAGAPVKLPANFPDDFPIYPKSRLIEAYSELAGEGKSILRVKWEGPGKVDAALEYYYRELAKNGWAHRMEQDLQTKRITIWRESEPDKLNLLLIGPVDETEQRDGVLIGLRLTL